VSLGVVCGGYLLSRRDYTGATWPYGTQDVLREQQQQQKERKEKNKSITGQRKTVREMNE
jgi:hypothetical protein